MNTDPRADTAQLLDTSSGLGDAARYALAAAAVMLATLGAAQIASLPEHEVDAAADTESAIAVDLPPAAASAPGQSGSDETAQQAVAASAPDVRPPDDTVPEEPQPEAAPPLAAPELPPVAEQPAAVLERAAPPPPKADAAPPPQEARIQAGSDKTKDRAVVADEPEPPQASAHALTVWQRAMALRLQSAKRSVPRRAGGSGTVQVAFTIDRNGNVVADKVDRTSGNVALDAAAATLVRKAAPYPVPPAGARDVDLIFKVPIRFRQ